MPTLSHLHCLNYNVTLKPLNICVTLMRQNADYFFSVAMRQLVGFFLPVTLNQKHVTLPLSVHALTSVTNSNITTEKKVPKYQTMRHFCQYVTGN